MSSMSSELCPAGSLPSMSMVITCYNVAPYVEEALTSCLNQEYDGPWELVIVDDCSTDETKDIIERVVREAPSSKDITVIRHSVNQGVAGATDSGFKAAKYDWILAVDGDDIQFPDRCLKTARLIQMFPDVGLITLSMENIRATGAVFGYTVYCKGACSRDEYNKAPSYLYIGKEHERILNWLGKSAQSKVQVYAGAMALKRSFVQRWGALQQRVAQDPPWELRAVLSTPILGSRELACQYRMHDHNLLNRQWNYRTPQGLAEIERFQSHYQQFTLQTFLCMQKDLLRACKDKKLTTCSPEDLSLVLQRITITLNSCRLRAGWWDICWPARLWRAFKYRTQILDSLRFWAWPRLLPLSVFCWWRRRTLVRRSHQRKS